MDRVLSKSYITALEEGVKAELSVKIRELVENAEDKVWIDEGSGTFGECSSMFLLTRWL